MSTGHFPGNTLFMTAEHPFALIASCNHSDLQLVIRYFIWFVKNKICHNSPVLLSQKLLSLCSCFFLFRGTAQSNPARPDSASPRYAAWYWFGQKYNRLHMHCNIDLILYGKNFCFISIQEIFDCFNKFLNLTILEIRKEKTTSLPFAK